MRPASALPLALVLPALLPAQRHCVTASVPAALPMAMEVIDSVALAAALPERALPSTTFSLWYSSGGQLTHVLALDDSLVARRQASPDSNSLARANLAAVIAGTAFPRDSGVAVTFRLTVRRDSAGAVKFAVGPSVDCGPIAHATLSPPHQTTDVTLDDITELRQAGSLSATVTIDAGGRPHDVQIVRSSGSRLFDDETRESLGSSRYDPALVDGFPRDTTLHIRTGPPTIAP